MRIGDLLIFGAQIVDIGTVLLLRHKRLHGADGAARVGDIDRLAAMIIRMDFDGRMHTARRRAADQQRQIEAFALHLRGDEAHFVERRRDEAGEADAVDLLGLRAFRGSSAPAP